MLKHLILAAFLTCGAIAAQAQTTNQPSTPAAPSAPTAPSRDATKPTAPAAPAMVSTGDFNVSGEMAGSAIIGAKVHDASGETIGKIDEIYVDDSGAIKVVVLKVGGWESAATTSL
jgi:glucose/arabinose dehydrogenase